MKRTTPAFRCAETRDRGVLLVALLAAAFVVQVRGQSGRAAETPDSAVSVDSIVRGLAELEDAVKSLEATCLCLDEINILRPGAKHDPQYPVADNLAKLRRKSEQTWAVLRDGRGRFEAAIEAHNTRDDGTTFETSEQIVSTFDGGSGWFFQKERLRDGVAQPAMARKTGALLTMSRTPFDLATTHVGQSVSELIAKGKAKIGAPQTWDDRPVVVLEIPQRHVHENFILRQEIWVDVPRRAAVRRISYAQVAADKPWGLSYQVDLKDYVEAAPGIWLPQTIDVWNYHTSDVGQDFLVSKDHCEVLEWKVNEAIDPSRFKQEAPPQEGMVGDAIWMEKPAAVSR
jgi:hypothetical protein